MTILKLSGFTGENRALHPLLLPETTGVVSMNQKPGRGDLRPWLAPAPVASVLFGRKTIYRMGRSTPSDTNYWLSWNTEVHTVVAPNADETSERTYYTGDGTPKWTDTSKALSGSPLTYPTVWRELGVPAPTTAPTCTVTVAAADADIGYYNVRVFDTIVNGLEVGDYLRITVGVQPEQFVTLTAGTGGAVTMESLAAQLDPIVGISASVVAADATYSKHVRLLSDEVGLTFKVEKKTGTEESYALEDITYGSYRVNVTGSSGAVASATLSVSSGWAIDERYEVVVNSSPPFIVSMIAGDMTFPPAVNAASLAVVFGSVPGLTASASADGVNCSISTTLTGASAKIQVRRVFPKQTNTYVTLLNASKVEAPQRTNQSRYYVYTYVTDIGEESAPSPPSTEVICTAQDTVNILAMAAPPSGAYGINRIRVYRTQTGSASTDFYYLTEVLSTQTTATDSGQDVGEVLPTTYWTPPPADLQFLTAMWNGMMAGISGRSVRVCEAYVPYAWPTAYEILPANSTPVALATYGQTLVVLTNEAPVLVMGSGPDALDEQPVEFLQACIAPLSAVGMGSGVAWSCPDGLAFVGSGGARLLTEGIMTRDDWQALNPETIVGVLYERRYFGFYTDDSGERRAFILDPANNSGMYFLDFGCDALFLDPLLDAMYVLNGATIARWDAGTSKQVRFKSKIFRAPKPITSYACAEVRADVYPVTFKMWADGALIHTESVESSLAFRLPSGFTAQEFQFEITANGPVQGVVVANSMHELAVV